MDELTRIEVGEGARAAASALLTGGGTTPKGAAKVPIAPPIPTVTLQVANPSPLGLASFAITTFVMSMFESGVLSTSLSKTVVPLGYFYAGTVQILAGLLQFLAHDTFGCTAFCSFGAFWVSYAYFVMAIEPLLDKDDLHSAKGVFVLPWVVLSAYMTVISLRTARVLTVTFVLLTLTLFVQTVGQFADSKGCQKAGGWIAFITSLSAGYCSCAFLFLETWKEEILPILFHEHIPVKRRSVVRGFSLSLTPD